MRSTIPPSRILFRWRDHITQAERHVKRDNNCWLQALNHCWHQEYATHPVYDTQLEESEWDALANELLDDRRHLENLGYPASIEVRFGDPAEEIVDLAQSAGADIVALATHGQTGLRQLVLGSVAKQVLHRLAIPVLLVRPFGTERDQP
jgi:nucleotide-binding universal stress UspA family protein